MSDEVHADHPASGSSAPFQTGGRKRHNASRSRHSAHRAKNASESGRLRIGDNWNVITIIALSQNNPLKAIAEFVENSIDANAKTISIVRGKERGAPFLKIVDDGEGVPRDPQGAPDFRYVATHIGDSLKRRLKEKGIGGIQGEFGIGLLSFWTVGERMRLSSTGADGKTYQMEMRKNEPGYNIFVRKTLFSHKGTELFVHPLLPGLRQLNGERIQSYLASELRDRIRKSGVRIHILDRTSKKELEVQPRQFGGRLLREIGAIPAQRGEIYVELYLNSQSAENHVGLYRSGTRVVASLTELDALNKEPWTSGFLQGMIDAPFLQLTPGTRTGVVHDESFEAFCMALEPVEARLSEIIVEEKTAEEEQASRNILKSVRKAFKEAFLTLSSDDYQWLDVRKQTAVQRATGEEGSSASTSSKGGDSADAQDAEGMENAISAMGVEGETASGEVAEREFFNFPGSLFSAAISPASVVMKVRTERTFRCLARDKSRRTIDEGVDISWAVKEGFGFLSSTAAEIVTYTAPEEPGMTVLEVLVRQADVTVTAEARITISETLIEKEPRIGEGRGKGLPAYTFVRAPGELWRSKYDEKNNLIVINNGHRDYVFSTQKHARKLRYICRLFAKELVLANFPGFDSRELLERVIELLLYAEEHLK
jgi:hypothetical protein